MMSSYVIVEVAHAYHRQRKLYPPLQDSSWRSYCMKFHARDTRELGNERIPPCWRGRFVCGSDTIPSHLTEPARTSKSVSSEDRSIVKE